MAYTRNGNLVISDEAGDLIQSQPGDVIFGNGGDDTISLPYWPLEQGLPASIDGGSGVDRVVIYGQSGGALAGGTTYTSIEIVRWSPSSANGETFAYGDFSNLTYGLHLEVVGAAMRPADHRGPAADIAVVVGATNFDDRVEIIGTPFGPTDQFATVDLGAGDDTAIGSAGRDFVGGKLGNDFILGQAGDDWLEGGDGDDIIAGGADHDRIEGQAGHDWLEGNAGNDVILGGTGNDRLEGGDGNDYLVGGPGYDLIIGGEGSDVFEFHDSDIQAGNWATIADFGKTATDYDGILLEGFGDHLAFYQDGANTLIYDSSIGLVGGVIVQNTTIAELQGHLGIV